MKFLDQTKIISSCDAKQQHQCSRGALELQVSYNSIRDDTNMSCFRNSVKTAPSGSYEMRRATY